MAQVLGVDPTTFEKDWEESLFDRCLGRLGSAEETMNTLAARQGVRPHPEAFQRALTYRLDFYRSVLASCAPVLPGIDALLAAGVRLVIVSTTTVDTPRLWSNSPLGYRIPLTVFSCDLGFCKPDPRFYQKALTKLSLSARECVFVGDGGSRELSGALSAGIAAYLYKFPGGGPEDSWDPEVNWSGPQLKDLSELVRRAA